VQWKTSAKCVRQPKQSSNGLAHHLWSWRWWDGLIPIKRSADCIFQYSWKCASDSSYRDRLWTDIFIHMSYICRKTDCQSLKLYIWYPYIGCMNLSEIGKERLLLRPVSSADEFSSRIVKHNFLARYILVSFIERWICFGKPYLHVVLFVGKCC
jgi:hypothetical protein